jgi:hypothetical protein
MFIPLFDGALIVFASFIGVLTENLFAKKASKYHLFFSFLWCRIDQEVWGGILVGILLV